MYNRGYLIERLYRALQRQTVQDFEWVVVNDGSLDDTHERMEDILACKNRAFEILYIHTQNGGKHRAINRGVKKAKGEWFFIVDSDDYPVDNAVEMILAWVKDLPAHFAGVGFSCLKPQGGIIGTTFKGDYLDAFSTERVKYGITGDKKEVWRTALMRQYPFPAFEGENFLTEVTVWFAFSQAGHPVRWVNQGLAVCEYLKDGLSAKALELSKKNFNGYTYAVKLSLSCYLPVFERMKIVGNYIYTGKLIGKKISGMRQDVHAGRVESIVSYLLCKGKKWIRK